MKRTFPCKCSHSKSLHGKVGPPIGEEWCDGTFKTIESWTVICECYKYVPDNLRYLEQCYKKRGKIK
jgi:hypothetical protein